MTEKKSVDNRLNNTNNQHQTVQYLEIDEHNHQQRLDNFLFTTLKGMPKSRIYRLIRKGEVRVNKKRCKALQRLLSGDLVRIPPMRIAIKPITEFVPTNLKHALAHNILFEDDYLMVINKPSGFAVHGGTGINSGIIEAIRLLRPDAKFLELVHRLDRDTSGCLIIAKNRSALRQLHTSFRDDGVQKTYQALLAGYWQRKKLLVNVSLLKNISNSGKRMVVVSRQGKASETLFRRVQKFNHCTWVEASPKTGRTHQIRVHAAWLGHAIVGDQRYGQMETNRFFKKIGFNHLVLHARCLVFEHPNSGETLTIEAPLPAQLQQLIEHL